eukprot:g4929.t1
MPIDSTYYRSGLLGIIQYLNRCGCSTIDIFKKTVDEEEYRIVQQIEAAARGEAVGQVVYNSGKLFQLELLPRASIHQCALALKNLIENESIFSSEMKENMIQTFLRELDAQKRLSALRSILGRMSKESSTILWTLCSMLKDINTLNPKQLAYIFGPLLFIGNAKATMKDLQNMRVTNELVEFLIEYSDEAFSSCFSAFDLSKPQRGASPIDLANKEGVEAVRRCKEDCEVAMPSLLQNLEFEEAARVRDRLRACETLLTEFAMGKRKNIVLGNNAGKEDDEYILKLNGTSIDEAKISEKIQFLEKEMLNSAKAFEFEKAAKLRTEITRLKVILTNGNGHAKKAAPVIPKRNASKVTKRRAAPPPVPTRGASLMKRKTKESSQNQKLNFPSLTHPSSTSLQNTAKRKSKRILPPKRLSRGREVAKKRAEKRKSGVRVTPLRLPTPSPLSPAVKRAAAASSRGIK